MDLNFAGVFCPVFGGKLIDRDINEERGSTYQADQKEKELVNAALYLRRPLLITGNPGTGKSSLAYAVAYELNLGNVLVWPITTRTTLQGGLYSYDAIARLQDASLREYNLHKKLADMKKQAFAQQTDRNLPKEVPKETSKPDNPDDYDSLDIGKYIRLGPLGTAFTLSKKKRPRVLLIDEIDKSDINLPNDLLHVFEEGRFEIPELSRLPETETKDFDKIEVQTHLGEGKVEIERGLVKCKEFPFVVITSNGEKDLPPAFLRRCLRLDIDLPDEDKLARIVKEKLTDSDQFEDDVKELLEKFLDERGRAVGNNLATDQLLNAVHLVMQGIKPLDSEELRKAVYRPLSE